MIIFTVGLVHMANWYCRCYKHVAFVGFGISLGNSYNAELNCPIDPAKTRSAILHKTLWKCHTEKYTVRMRYIIFIHLYAELLLFRIFKFVGYCYNWLCLLLQTKTPAFVKSYPSSPFLQRADATLTFYVVTLCALSRFHTAVAAEQCGPISGGYTETFSSKI